MLLSTHALAEDRVGEGARIAPLRVVRVEIVRPIKPRDGTLQIAEQPIGTAHGEITKGVEGIAFERLLGVAPCIGDGAVHVGDVAQEGVLKRCERESCVGAGKIGVLGDGALEKRRGRRVVRFGEKGARKRFGDMPYRLVEQDWAKDRFLTFRDKHSVGWRPCKLAVAKAHKSRKGRDLPLQAEFGSFWIVTGGPKPYGFQYRETPKAADHLTNTLGACLSWAKSRGKIRINPIEGLKRLYRNNRAAIIWLAENMLKLKAGAAVDPPKPLSPQLWDAVCLAALTGLALSDLLRLSWGMVLDQVIDLEGGRKKTGVEAMPPILPATRALLDRLRRQQGGNPEGSATVLLNSWGKPWTPSGFSSSFQAAKERAGIGRELHFHDLRGTAATMFAAEGYSDLQIDLFMGWTEGDSAGIRRRYLTARNVARALTELLQSVGAAVTGIVPDAASAG